jgi:translation initiation factor IF-1
MLDRDPREPERSTVVGTVRESLPYAQYRVEIDGNVQVTAHAPSGPGKNFIRVLIGDRVRLAERERSDAGADCGEGQVKIT